MSLIYAAAQAAFSDGLASWTGDSFFAALVTSAYGPAAGDTPSDVPTVAVVATQPIAGRVIAGGAIDGNDVVFPALAGAAVAAVLIGRGTDFTDCDLLVMHLTSGNLPLTPNGTDVTVTWDNGPNRIARL